MVIEEEVVIVVVVVNVVVVVVVVAAILEFPEDSAGAPSERFRDCSSFRILEPKS